MAESDFCADVVRSFGCNRSYFPDLKSHTVRVRSVDSSFGRMAANIHVLTLPCVLGSSSKFINAVEAPQLTSLREVSDRERLYK